MPSDRQEAAAETVRAAKSHAREVSAWAASVRTVAYEVIADAKRRIKSAAIRGAVWRIFELVAQYTFAGIGIVLYVLICLIGLAYSVGYYDRFEDDIHILSYFDTADFLLSAFGNLGSLVAGVALPVLTVIVLVVGYYQASTSHARRGVYRDRSDASRGSFRTLIVTTLPIVAIMGTVLLSALVSFEWGKCDSVSAVENPTPVRVTIRNESPQSKTRLPVPAQTILLGTTSNFHLFYECANDLTSGDHSKCEEGSGQKKARPFVVPTANVAAVAFDLRTDKSGDDGPTVGGLAPLELAIATLSKTIAGLDLPGDEVSKLAQAVSTLNGTVEGLGLSSDGASVVAQAIGKLTEAVGNLDVVATVNVGSDAAISLETTELAQAINALSATMAFLRIDGAQDQCATGLEKLGSVGTFPVGWHKPADPTAPETPLSTRMKEIHNDLFGDRTPRRIMLIGRVDITQLKDRRRDVYGADGGLAQARAKWVQQEFLKKSSKRQDQTEVLDRALLLSAGPLSIGFANPADRAVEVWACWPSKQ